MIGSSSWVMRRGCWAQSKDLERKIRMWFCTRTHMRSGSWRTRRSQRLPTLQTRGVCLVSVWVSGMSPTSKTPKYERDHGTNLWTWEVKIVQNSDLFLFSLVSAAEILYHCLFGLFRWVRDSAITIYHQNLDLAKNHPPKNRYHNNYHFHQRYLPSALP